MGSNRSVARPAGRYFQRRRALIRGRLLDAACEELLARSWQELSMVEVARQAGVHRSSLYSEFGTREALMRALFARETQRLLTRVAGALAEHAPSPARALEAAFLAFLEEAESNGPLCALLRRESPELAALARAQQLRVLTDLREALTATWPELADDQAASLAEWLVRFGVSVAYAPVSDRERTPQNIGRLLGFWVQARLAGKRPPSSRRRLA